MDGVQVRIRQECGGIEIGKGEVPNGLNGRQNKALNAGEVAAVEFFNSHIEEVRNDLNALKKVNKQYFLGKSNSPLKPIARF